MELPRCETLALTLQGTTLQVTLNRPEVRNAMSLEMVQELEQVLDTVTPGDRAGCDGTVRTLVLRGAGGHFCAGGDIKDMSRAATASGDELARTNRRYGAMITRMERMPQAVVAVLEGAVMGGGIGLACVADVAIALADATFRLPETSIGLPPAQIAPFLVRRLGLSQARRLAVTGGQFRGPEALALGLVHFVCDDAAALDQTLASVLGQIDRCAPGAIAVTKGLMLEAQRADLEAVLDRAAAQFAAAARGPEGVEGMTAFIQKRRPAWCRSDG